MAFGKKNAKPPEVDSTVEAIRELKQEVSMLRRDVIRAGVVSGVIAQRGPGADFREGFTALVDNIEKIINGE